jgi:hypothetical protein
MPTAVSCFPPRPVCPHKRRRRDREHNRPASGRPKDRPVMMSSPAARCSGITQSYNHAIIQSRNHAITQTKVK